MIINHFFGEAREARQVMVVEEKDEEEKRNETMQRDTSTLIVFPFIQISSQHFFISLLSGDDNRERQRGKNGRLMLTTIRKYGGSERICVSIMNVEREENFLNYYSK